MTRSWSKVLVAGLITVAAALPARAEDGARRTSTQRVVSATTTVAPAPTAQAPTAPQVDNRQHQCQSLLCNRYVIIGMSF
jgi:hypothetical protein